MNKAVILTVDDEPQVLNAIYRDLRKKYQREYRILKANSGEEALTALEELHDRNTPVALLLVDQRMPRMTGTELLKEAGLLHPDAKKALLTAYADTEAAIQSINTIGLDYYLQKPWDPPEENLYPIIDDLLEDWHQNVPPVWDGIRVAGTMWSPASHELKDFLARNRIAYLWQDVESDPDARARCDVVTHGKREYPVVFFPDGTALVAPDRQAVASRIGMKTTANQPLYDLLIVGGGPAGLGAAVYGASEGLSTALVEREATGGQAGTSSLIENYLGFPAGVRGGDLANRAVAQAKRFGAELLTPQEVVEVRVEQPYKYVTLADGTVVTCFALLMCPGMEVRRLDVAGVDRFTGRGVYYGAALTEAVHYRDRPAVVVGGANSAGQAAKFFARYSSQVTMLIRRSIEDSMSQYLIDQIAEIPNIRVLNHTEVKEVKGGDKLESLVVHDNQSDEQFDLEAAAMYVFIGSHPRTSLVADLLALDPGGFILTGEDVARAGKAVPGFVPAFLESSVPGIFAAGDARSGSQKRVAAAVGEGAVAVALVHRYLASVR